MRASSPLRRERTEKTRTQCTESSSYPVSFRQLLYLLLARFSPTEVDPGVGSPLSLSLSFSFTRNQNEREIERDLSPGYEIYPQPAPSFVAGFADPLARELDIFRHFFCFLLFFSFFSIPHRHYEHWTRERSDRFRRLNNSTIIYTFNTT